MCPVRSASNSLKSRMPFGFAAFLLSEVSAKASTKINLTGNALSGVPYGVYAAYGLRKQQIVGAMVKSG